MILRVNLEVTEEDIRLGQRNSTSSCPIALALKREFGLPADLYGRISVNRNYIAIQPEIVVYDHDCSPWMTAWMERFDHDPRSVQPFSKTIAFQPRRY